MKTSMISSAWICRFNRCLVMPAVCAVGLIGGGCGGNITPQGGQTKPPDQAYIDAVNNPPPPPGAKPGGAYPDTRSRRELREDIRARRAKAETPP
jgi:hypothetical protein